MTHAVEQSFPIQTRKPDRQTIAALNDAFRTTGIGGRTLFTHSIAEESPEVILAITRAVQGFADFTPDNDPHGEHDFGNFTIAGDDFYWKIDYYDTEMQYLSERPDDPLQTNRVLTTMRTEEY